MVEIGDTIVSFDLFEETFCCDLNTCRGACCVEGDSGAPIEMDEVAEIEEVLTVIEKDLTPEAKEVIEKQGVAYVDCQGDLVTSIVNGRECVFSYVDSADGIRKCAIEKAYREGKSSFMKPVSCHLYPVRLTKYSKFTAVNYHRWDICECAVKCGKGLKLPLYKFLKEPLIRRFGKEWYAELELAADAYEKQFNKFIDI